MAPGGYLAVAAALVLAACGSGAGGAGEGGGASPTAGPGSSGGTDDGKIDCAIDGMSAFTHTCSVERKSVDGKRTLVVRHPDGAFRRFEIVTDGRGIIPADGAQAGTATLDGGALELKVDDDRYRFPATIADASS